LSFTPDATGDADNISSQVVSITVSLLIYKGSNDDEKVTFAKNYEPVSVTIRGIPVHSQAIAADNQ